MAAATRPSERVKRRGPHRRNGPSNADSTSSPRPLHPSCRRGRTAVFATLSLRKKEARGVVADHAIPIIRNLRVETMTYLRIAPAPIRDSSPALHRAANTHTMPAKAPRPRREEDRHACNPMELLAGSGPVLTTRVQADDRSATTDARPNFSGSASTRCGTTRPGTAAIVSAARPASIASHARALPSRAPTRPAASVRRPASMLTGVYAFRHGMAQLRSYHSSPPSCRTLDAAAPAPRRARIPMRLRRKWHVGTKKSAADYGFEGLGPAGYGDVAKTPSTATTCKSTA